MGRVNLLVKRKTIWIQVLQVDAAHYTIHRGQHTETTWCLAF